VAYQANSVTQVVITVSATGNAAAGSLYAFGAAIALPPGITDTSGMPLSTALARGSTLSTNTFVTSKYSAPTTLSGSLLFGVADLSGFSIGPVATITGSIASGITPPGASSYTVSNPAAHDSIGNPVSGIGGSVTVKYQ
jgi:hypothetical protein